VLFPGVQLSEVARCSPLSQLSLGISTCFLVLFLAHRPLSGFYKFTSIHFPKPLEFQCQILVFVHFLLLLLLYACVSGHCDTYEEYAVLLSLSIYDCNIGSSVFNHVVRLDTYITDDFQFLRLYHWCSRMLVPLFQTRQTIHLTQTPLDNSGDFVMSLRNFKTML